jgi:hypothetical protein
MSRIKSKRVTPKNSKARQRALANGYRSGLEEKVGKALTKLGVKYGYEDMKINYTQPAKYRTYTPDFTLPNGIIIETKGRFTSDDRQKHVWIKSQQPKLDIRFVFSNSNQKLYKGAKSTYADWCIKHGFLYADKMIPQEWIDE